MLQTFELLKRIETGENSLGQATYEYQTYRTFKGYIDLMGGSDNQGIQDALIAETTHMIFTQDAYLEIQPDDHIRHVETNEEYEVNYSDNPMQRYHHLEIFVRQVV